MSSRSSYKGPYVCVNLLKKCASSPKGIVKTTARGSTIVSSMVGVTIGIHNGKQYVPVLITNNHIGFKLGEFSDTRKPPKHPSNNKSKR